MNVDKKQHKKVYRPGREVLSVLKKKLLSQPYMLEYKVVWIDTVCKWLIYRNVPKFSDRQVWANSADPDQTAPRGAV